MVGLICHSMLIWNRRAALLNIQCRSTLQVESNIDMRGTSMRRVSYHQSVFDLLDMQPPNSVEAESMIESWERQQGQRLPEAVRQWYLIENVVAIRDVEEWPRRNEEGHLWYD